MLEKLHSIGLGIIVLGVFVMILAVLFSGGNKADTKAAVVGFIGPIPFGFGNDKAIMFAAIAVTVLFFIGWLIVQVKIR
ncbi:MAG: DUF131 domain-containing protein [Nanoarchaeota archaeon]